MDSIVFVLVALVSVIVGFIIDGGSVINLIHVSPAIIVFGGTIGAVGTSFPIGDIKKLGSIVKVALSKPKSDLPALIAYFKQIAFKTRKEGLLSIEEMISDESVDPFIKKGLQMVVDGIEPQTVKDTLELSVELIEERHNMGASIFQAAGGYAPTLGIIGTVCSLVVVLANLSSDTSQLGESISSAFLATLYGISSANLVYLPIANKLKRYNAIEIQEKNLIIEAILCIQEGINPNTLDEKLKGFLDKKQLQQYESMGAGEGE
ncbi:chemotaxis protein MotA [Clostridium acetobutylicum]|uniref:Chemotaxis motility protein A, gene motA n=1 Tax=Clostridium acetobutylicum (strain ATCC 824 / DSM 792 / JCM 1419 / IAM 19013 / LMG 5710 / NBRC 13948 / NRRL B-527 / VKM B-1787 / 2291 / W) TaxID=272562 RepID=Q97M94_CLOAB|nr:MULTISPECIES: motility protein A [Clostridium]AAK78285.1 Chemotaxis motility protein A, gene motA [Clostridium acetobutylicum ATCC 824]ADZ19352.1 Chemotaxis motility protein A, gene motA [Clostridium acetobutylicum EA 2018]AEI34577.1 chemotaxis motility protein A, motA [Clostridium acetobutylicum DSM 1731]AWV80011.1 motility protein A [Clostridium acetobutylicum]KHD35409.1 flagellar motor protein MotA [Clostridium acetobutylicum]